MVKFSYWYPSILGIGTFSLIYWSLSDDPNIGVMRVVVSLVGFLAVFLITNSYMAKYREKRKNKGVETKK